MDHATKSCSEKIMKIQTVNIITTWD